MIQIEQLEKKYQHKLVLSVPRLEIGVGIHWLQGANGSGKSTLLKIIGGLIPYSGTVTLNGINLKKKPVEYKGMISYAEAEPLYPEFLSGKDLIHFYNTTRKADSKKSDELIQLFAIQDYCDQPIGTYSSGMCKRLSLVLALIGSTKFILLDEPFVTLDVGTVRKLTAAMIHFHSQGTNFIFTSHQSPEDNALPISRQWLVENNTVREL
jgi:ABC-2 type transport system ATP-binding protein